ncbi:hypothetical protein HPB47_002295 [Ixodes persulcatus]|uniref:Uncharacterized protein n=1 Tax=Ixodes persulcatus TaxID=34615 RepID=A0AC60PLL7_IXOPE|nr:hypothetical protein HPB47_002295 [Ixodes persulcatus]
MLGLVFTVVSRVVWTQSIRRHYLATAVELVFVLASCYLLINEFGRPKPGTLHFREPRMIIAEPVTLAHTLNWTVALYGPSTPYTDDLIRKAFHEHQDMVSSIPSLGVKLSANNESVCGHMPLKLGSDVFAACENATAIPDTDDKDNDTVSDVEVKVYRKKRDELQALRQFKGRIVCVRFGDDTDAKSPSLEYTMHFFVSSISNDFLKLNRPKNFFLTETNSRDAQLLDKLHGVQIRINRAHLELQNEQHTWNRPWNYTTYQRFMPLPEFPTESQYYRPGVVVAAIALFWLFFRHLTNLTRETSSGLKASVPSVPGSGP